MRICLKDLQKEMPAMAGMGTRELCECLAMLGFPVDSVEDAGRGAVLDIDVTANRGDALSHRGLARDLAAKLGFALSPIPAAPGAERGAQGDAPIAIHIETDACAVYATAALKIDCAKPGQTPADAAAFLGAMGSNAKGLAPVDASNELLHRYGHPTHAFDADRLKGCVRIRMAREGETLLALDGAEYGLGPKDMVIADDSGPVAIAGVIGGDSTKVTEATKRVLLESAHFSPRSVTATARRIGVHTDASMRFGRGADPAFAETARDLLVQRLVSWAGAELLASWTIGRPRVGSRADGHADGHAGSPADSPAVLLTEKTLCRIAGEPVGMDEAKAILEGLGCAAEQADGGLGIRPPSWRHDLCIEEDFAEEVLRIRGYERLGSALPPLEGAPEPLPESYRQRRAVSRRLAHLGFYQTVTLGFIGPETDAGRAKDSVEGRTLRNPLGAEYSVMRSSLLPSLWGVAEANQHRGAKDVRLFEIAPVYESAPDGPRETSALAMVWAGTMGGEDPLSPARAAMAADLIAVARDLGVGGDPEIVELGPNAFGMEIPMERLGGADDGIIPRFRPFSRYPVVTRDISLLAPLGLRYGDLEASIKSALKGAPLTGVGCADVFKDAKLTAEGAQAWLVRLRFQSGDRTLAGDEVESWVATAIAAAATHGASLRAQGA
jgi:phenylalanyl-tRNA synthetase beta chain